MHACGGSAHPLVTFEPLDVAVGVDEAQVEVPSLAQANGSHHLLKKLLPSELLLHTLGV
jgi:hypothetical protein